MIPLHHNILKSSHHHSIHEYIIKTSYHHIITLMIFIISSYHEIIISTYHHIFTSSYHIISAYHICKSFGTHLRYDLEPFGTHLEYIWEAAQPMAWENERKTARYPCSTVKQHVAGSQQISFNYNLTTIYAGLFVNIYSQRHLLGACWKIPNLLQISVDFEIERIGPNSREFSLNSSVIRLKFTKIYSRFLIFSLRL